MQCVLSREAGRLLTVKKVYRKQPPTPWQMAMNCIHGYYANPTKWKKMDEWLLARAAAQYGVSYVNSHDRVGNKVTILGPVPFTPIKDA